MIHEIWWGKLARLCLAGGISLQGVSRRVGIPESARRMIWFCFDEAVRAPQPVIPARYFYIGTGRFFRDSPPWPSLPRVWLMINPPRLHGTTKKPATNIARVYLLETAGLCGPTCMDFTLLSQCYYYSAVRTPLQPLTAN
jgi:hypothetical protein